MAVTAVYLVMVASGRANLGRPPEGSFLQPFRFGYPRFHFFWVTLIWPWMAAALFRITDSVHVRPGLATALKAGIPVLTLIAAWSGSIFAHAAGYKEAIEYRAQTETACIRKSLMSGSNEMRCFANRNYDLMPAYLYARKIGSSFTKTFPLLPPTKHGDDAGLLFQLSTASPDRWRVNVAAIQASSKGVAFAPVRDPQIEFRTGKPVNLASCMELELVARVKPAANDFSQLFYLRPGESRFSESSSVRTRIAPNSEDAFIEVTLRAWSENGFLDRFRFDPGRGEYHVSLEEIELRCK
jgi:hypothetical protein